MDSSSSNIPPLPKRTPPSLPSSPSSKSPSPPDSPQSDLLKKAMENLDESYAGMEPISNPSSFKRIPDHELPPEMAKAKQKAHENLQKKEAEKKTSISDPTNFRKIPDHELPPEIAKAKQKAKAKESSISKIVDDFHLLILTPPPDINAYAAKIHTVVQQLLGRVEDFKSEGIFRISPDGNKKKVTVEKLMNNEQNPFPKNCSIHDLVGVLKQLLRDMKPALLQVNDTDKDKMQTILDTKDPEEKKALLFQYIQALSPIQKNILKEILSVVDHVLNNSQKNLMGAVNMGIAFGPSCYSSDDLIFGSQTVPSFTKLLFEQRADISSKISSP